MSLRRVFTVITTSLIAVLMLTLCSQPSLCVPWVKNSVTKDVLYEAFSQLGTLRQLDLVPKGEHQLCFVHFVAWDIGNPVVAAMRLRLLNPTSPAAKESVVYNHPTMGRQRWMVARSRAGTFPPTAAETKL